MGVVAVATSASSAAPSHAHASAGGPPNGPDSGPNIHHDKSPPLRSIPPEHTPGTGHPARPVPPGPSGLSSASAQNTSGPLSRSLAPTAGANFDGIGAGSPNTCGCAPPDNDVAAGPSQVVELVNTELAVYSKTGGTPILAESTNTLWSGFGGGCQTNNDGDGTVTYDTLAQRWVIQQFSVSTTPYLECVAVSTSSDATGSWYRYSFQYTDFPDYPKLGVWADAYYLSFNRYNSSGTQYFGPEVCAFNRAAMLTGATATQQCFTPSSYLGSLLPATLDGATGPPSGEPEWFVGINPNVTNALAYFKFHVDWTTPANTTLTGPTSLPVNAFSEACGGGICIPQSGTTQQLDSLGDRLMWRLEYRNFGNHEAMVVSHAVTAGSSVGMRWYELRPSGGALSVFQQGTYAPDSTYRWMGSIAMDHSGDMGLGYSTSSSSLHPGVAYTGRLATDPAGTMPQGETTMFTGAGSQTKSLSRWGDYSEMSVDPADDCTFWYVNEYLSANGTFTNWKTRIGSFKFSSCTSPQPPTVTTGSASNVTSSGATVAGTVNPNGQATTYHFDYGTNTNYGSQAPAPPDPSAGSGTTAQPETANLTNLSPGTTYHYRLEATNASNTTYGSDQQFTTPSPPTVTTGSASNVTSSGATVAGTVNPNGQATTYHFDYGTNTNYGSQAPAPPDPSAGSGTTAQPETANLTDLSPGTTYHYRLEATNASGTTYGSDQTIHHAQRDDRRTTHHHSGAAG